MLTVRERSPEKVVAGKRMLRDEADDDNDARAARPLEWRVLESGILALKTPIEVATADGGRRNVWYDPRKRQLVCHHGWGAFHVGVWNGPRKAEFPKPAWTTCDCRSRAGLCSRKKLGEDVVPEAPSPPSYYDTLVAAQGTEELRPGLVGTRVPGAVGADGCAFYMCPNDAKSVLRCKHGNTTHALGAQARERQRAAAGLVAAALVGHRVVAKALGGAGRDPCAPSRGARRCIVVLVRMLTRARAGRRARRGAVAACGCAPVFVKACAKGR